MKFLKKTLPILSVAGVATATSLFAASCSESIIVLDQWMPETYAPINGSRAAFKAKNPIKIEPKRQYHIKCDFRSQEEYEPSDLTGADVNIVTTIHVNSWSEFIYDASLDMDDVVVYSSGNKLTRVDTLAEVDPGEFYFGESPDMPNDYYIHLGPNNCNPNNPIIEAWITYKIDAGVENQNVYLYFQ